MKNNHQQQSNVMAQDAISTSTPAIQPITANEAPITLELRRWVDFVDQINNEMGPVHQDDQMAQFIKEAEEKRKAKAEKRLDGKLRKLEIEQKAILLAKAKESIDEGRHKCESDPQVAYDYTPRPTSCINDIFRAEKERNRLIALEQEQKAALYSEVMEKRAKELGDDWPGIQEMSQDPRFDHIPKPWPGDKEIIAKAFSGPQTSHKQEPNERQPTSTAPG